jgi:hypothetical protein
VLDGIDLQVLINGIQIPGLLKASIISTNCFSADTYTLTFAIGAQMLEGLAYWSQLSSATVEIVAQTSMISGPVSLITGPVDALHADPIQGIIGVEGRDLSSTMVDAYRQQDFVNQTASEIVSSIAQYHGLTPIVTPTTDIIGRYYGDGYSKLSLGQYSRIQSDWDLLVQIARQNEFDLFVQGQSLFFQPVSTSDFPVAVSMRDIQHLRIERIFSMPENNAANVQSWNSQNMAAYQSANADDNATSSETPASGTLPFLFSGSNYTSQQVTNLAQQYNNELSRLKTVLHMDMPWDLTLAPRTTVLLCETNSEFDTLYRIESIERHYSSMSGSLQTIYASMI